MSLIEVFKALSHKNRIRIINLIRQQNLCVCELQHITGISQSNASRHLNKLKQANIIYGKRDAQWVHYYINTNFLDQHRFLQLLLKEELEQVGNCREDNRRLKEYQESDLTCQDLR